MKKPLFGYYTPSVDGFTDPGPYERNGYDQRDRVLLLKRSWCAWTNPERAGASEDQTFWRWYAHGDVRNALRHTLWLYRNRQVPYRKAAS